MASSSKEQELAIKIAGKVENSFKQSLGVTEDGLNKIASVAKKAAAVAAAAFAAVKVGDFISGAVDEYAEFEQAMANTSAIAGASADDYAKLSAAAREAGKATTFTASEAADALGYMALAGWNVEESTAALTPVLKLAEATQADLATTSDQVTDSMSAMGVGIDDLQGYLDVIVTTNNKANTTAADLMDAFIGCGGAARAAGMNYKETSTALGILANNGIKGSEAGTALGFTACDDDDEYYYVGGGSSWLSYGNLEKLLYVSNCRNELLLTVWLLTGRSKRGSKRLCISMG